MAVNPAACSNARPDTVRCGAWAIVSCCLDKMADKEESSEKVGSTINNVNYLLISLQTGV